MSASRHGSVFQPINHEPTTYLGIKAECIHQELSDWSTYITVLHMIGRSKMNERLHDMTPNGILLDVSLVSHQGKQEKKKSTTNILFDLDCNSLLLLSRLKGLSITLQKSSIC